jgi:hypothetical protein
LIILSNTIFAVLQKNLIGQGGSNFPNLYCIKTRYYFRNQKRKIKMVRTCKNFRRKNCEKRCLRILWNKKRSVGKPRMRWLDDESDFKKTVGRGWRKIAKDRDTWKLVLKEAKVLHGPYSQWGGREYCIKICDGVCLSLFHTHTHLKNVMHSQNGSEIKFVCLSVKLL